MEVQREMFYTIPETQKILRQSRAVVERFIRHGVLTIAPRDPKGWAQITGGSIIALQLELAKEVPHLKGSPPETRESLMERAKAMA